MATSQSSFPSSHASQIKYDVFISFRGSDTRRGFLSHLLKALTQKNIEAYVDDKLKEGDELLPALFTAIEESQVALIILSEDYASSKWCLEELVKITECMMKKGQIVVPIFYKVDPSAVRHQKGCYKNAFDEHEKLLKDNIMNVEEWRAALKKVANLSGFHSINFGVHLPKGLQILPNKIRLHDWFAYPCKSLPMTFNAKYLVELLMPFSDVEKLWSGAQNLPNLKSVYRRGSKQLIELPDFSKAASLETVFLSGCANLISIHPSICTLQKLFLVDLIYCRRLENLPAIEELPSSVRRCGKPQYLYLTGCESLKHLHGISKLRNLRRLDLFGCKQLNTSNLHMLFDGLWSLRRLVLDECCNLYELPENISKLSYLVHLSLEGTNVKSLPESIKHLSQLRELYLSGCRRLQSLPEIPASVDYLFANDCTSLERLFTPTRELLEQYNRLCDSDADYLLGTAFSFRNCPNLDNDALDTILAYVNERNERARYFRDTSVCRYI